MDEKDSVVAAAGPYADKMSMVERVARRLASINSALMWERQSGYVGSDVMSAAQQDVYRVLARTAIEAMREPTVAMDSVGMDVEPTAYYSASDIYRAMIDTALSEERSQ